MMKEIQVTDVSLHMVEINRLVNRLNRLTRETFAPDIEAINDIVVQLSDHIEALKQLKETT